MRTILMALAVLCMGMDQVDKMLLLPVEHRCRIEAGMVGQGMYAYGQSWSVEEHIKRTRVFITRTPQEHAYLTRHMVYGRDFAENVLTYNGGPATVTVGWVAIEVHKYYDLCVAGENPVLEEEDESLQRI